MTQRSPLTYAATGVWCTICRRRACRARLTRAAASKLNASGILPPLRAKPTAPSDFPRDRREKSPKPPRAVKRPKKNGRPA